MSLKTKVKVGNITNLSDARYCAGMGASWLGFPMNEGNGSLLSPEKFMDITGWVSGPEFVLEAEQINLNELYSAIQGYPAQYIQLNVSQLELFNPSFIPGLMVSIDIHEWQSVRDKIMKDKEMISYLLIRNEREGNPNDMETLIAEMTECCPVLLGFGIVPEKLTDILQLPIEGIAINGSQEEKPGMKDYHQLAEILELLDTD